MPAGGAGIVPPQLVFSVSGQTAAQVLAVMAEHLARRGIVSDGPGLARQLVEREGRSSTALGAGIAIPHWKLHALPGVVVALGLARPPVDFAAPDGKPVDLVFLLLSPAESPATHLAALARLSRILRAPSLARRIREAGNPESVSEALREAEAGLMVSLK
jgi:PTS system nitrogen regulatory IIA component